MASFVKKEVGNMRKAKQHSCDITGDWSTTGTFLRKPSGGWLHEDRELQDGLSINYNVQVRKCRVGPVSLVPQARSRKPAPLTGLACKTAVSLGSRSISSVLRL